jgi:hypothetical protein
MKVIGTKQTVLATGSIFVVFATAGAEEVPAPSSIGTVVSELRPSGGSAMKAKLMTDEERKRALDIRAAWMRKMGLSQEEIESACKDDGSPIDLDEELDNLRAAETLPGITPPKSVLESWAIKY